MKANMAGSENSSGAGIVTMITAMIWWISKEHASYEPVIEFVARGRRSVWVAEATKHAQSGVVRGRTKKQFMW